jgi:hypothetical protein
MQSLPEDKSSPLTEVSEGSEVRRSYHQPKQPLPISSSSLHTSFPQSQTHSKDVEKYAMMLPTSLSQLNPSNFSPSSPSSSLSSTVQSHANSHPSLPTSHVQHSHSMSESRGPTPILNSAGIPSLPLTSHQPILQHNVSQQELVPKANGKATRSMLPWTSPALRSSPTDQLISAILDGDVKGIQAVVKAKGEDLNAGFWRDLTPSILPLHRCISGLHFHGSEKLLVVWVAS